VKLRLSRPRRARVFTPNTHSLGQFGLRLSGDQGAPALVEASRALARKKVKIREGGIVRAVWIKTENDSQQIRLSATRALSLRSRP
jgi:hypothetical protein